MLTMTWPNTSFRINFEHEVKNDRKKRSISETFQKTENNAAGKTFVNEYIS